MAQAGRPHRGGLGQIVPRDTAQAGRPRRGGLGQSVPRGMAQAGRPRRGGLGQIVPRGTAQAGRPHRVASLDPIVSFTSIVLLPLPKVSKDGFPFLLVPAFITFHLR
ncbi:hypothetical protein C4D60_Mb04t13730 [Musa balbisiana]|uniref:Uncharacterized protein n=1 Tax=Musa balbisiana TaxID=52838 RepID=A0A4V4H9R2_MUSBA|nr:hypothetical protein C4D60_Mb04t13730 [Musa balbisiana]